MCVYFSDWMVDGKCTYNLICRLMCRQESYFAYLFGVVEPGFYRAIVSLAMENWSFCSLGCNLLFYIAGLYDHIIVWVLFSI